MTLEYINGIEWYKFLAQEKPAECHALRTLYGTGYTDCFRLNGIEPSIIELDGDGNPKENRVPKTDKHGMPMYDKNGDQVTKQVDLILLEGHTIPNKVNWKKFLDWAKEPEPVWFCDSRDGLIVPNGTKDRYTAKMELWETKHRTGANQGKVNRMNHPKQRKLLNRYIDFTVNYWTMWNKHDTMNTQGWGFASEWAYQEMARIINFNKKEIPEMYRTVHACLDANINTVTRQNAGIVVAKALNLIGMDLTNEHIDQMVNTISERLLIDDETITALAQSIIDELSKQMHNLFLLEKRTVSPVPFVSSSEQKYLYEKAS